MTLGARLRSPELLAIWNKIRGGRPLLLESGTVLHIAAIDVVRLRWLKMDAGQIHYHISRTCTRHNVLS